jgi:hypothetical protein
MQMRAASVLVICRVLLGFATACSSSDDDVPGTPGADGGADARTDLQDGADGAFVLSLVEPASESTDVGRDTAVQLRFNRPAATASLADAVTLASQAGAVATDVSADGSIVTLRPRARLAPATEYTVSVSAAVTDAGGRALEHAVTARFTTRARGWSSVEPLAQAAGTHFVRPRVVVDAADRALVLFEGCRSPTNDCRPWSAALERGASWTAAAMIQGPSESLQQLGLRMDVSDSGRAVAVWRNVLTDAVHAVRHVPGGGWTELPTTPADGATSAPEVAMTPDGGAIVMWRHKPVQTVAHDLLWRSFPATGAAGAALPVEAEPSTVSVAALDIGRSLGQAVWVQLAAGETSLWASTLAGTTWSPPTDIDAFTIGQHFVYEPALSVGRGDHAFAVWRQDTGTGARLYLNRFVPAPVPTWQGAVPLPDLLPFVELPIVAADASGNADVLWLQSRAGEPSRVWSARWIAGTGFASADALEPTVGAQGDDSESHRVVASVDGSAVAVWTREAGARRELWVARRDGIAWSDGERKADVGAADDDVPLDVAIGPHGDAVVVWSQIDGTQRVVRGIRFQ